MSKTNGVSGPERYVVGARLLGKDKNQKKGSRIVEYAIEVVLSDESQYTTYRSIKEIAMLQSRLLSRFPVEAGYFSKTERVIPECPVRQTIFGPQRTVRDDRSFEKLLNLYLKELPALPASIVKSNFMRNFFILRANDINLPEQKNANADQKKKKKVKPLTRARAISADSIISGPMKLRSYFAVAPYSDQKSKFSFSEGAILQLLQKDPSGWWMVDLEGLIGWAPASFLVPVDEEDLPEEANENEQLIGVEKVGARYISISSYQASRDDELSFVRGAVVRVIQKYIDGWWLVRYNGGEGFVPGALFRKFDRRQSSVYVKKIKRKFISQKSVRIVPTMKPKWFSQNESTGGLTLYKCMAKFSGSSDRFEISLNKNDVVKVLDRKDHGWWYVEDLHGRSGWAPATYLKRVLDREHQTNGTQGGELVGSTHEVLQPHRAQLEDELSVQKGEKVVVVCTSDDGWWMVRNAETQQQGLIPSVCLKHASEDSPTVSSTPSFPDLNLDEDDTSTWSELERLQEDTPFPESEDNHIYDDIAEFAEEECYIATQGYARQAPDELDIDEGQLVCVIDDTHRDMWYVTVDGKEGWLPSALLRIITDEELGGSAATSPSRTKLSSHGASADASDLSDSDDLGSFSPSNLLPQSSPALQRRRGSSPLGIPKQFSLPETTASNLRGKISLGTDSMAWNGRRKISLPNTTAWNGRRKISLPDTTAWNGRKISLGTGSEPDTTAWNGRRKISLPDTTAWSGRRKISLGTGSDSELLEYTSAESPVTILVENRSLEELEREAAQAEKMAAVSQRRAKVLRDRARRLGSPGFSSD